MADHQTTVAKIGSAWSKIHEAHREMVRRAAGKKPTPTVANIGSQSVKSTDGGEMLGFDGGKRIVGRKRHIAVDTLGLVLNVVVHSACVQDYDGAKFVGAKFVAIGLGERYRRSPRLSITPFDHWLARELVDTRLGTA